MAMMTDEQVYQEFDAAGARLRGHFELSSGLHSDGYLQCALVLMDAARGARLCAALAEKIAAFGVDQIDYIVSPAMGGVIVGYEMGRVLGVPAMFLERIDGVFELRRGFKLDAGTRVLVVEDVVTTGLSSVEAIEVIRGHEAEVLAVACLVDRTESSALRAFDVPLIGLTRFDIRTFDAADIPPDLQKIPVIKPGSRGGV